MTGVLVAVHAVLTTPGMAEQASPLDTLRALALVAVVVVVWIAAVVRWKWIPCGRRHCRGGKIAKPGKGPRAWRDCPACGGRGRRVRPGAKFWRWALRMDKR